MMGVLSLPLIRHARDVMTGYAFCDDCVPLKKQKHWNGTKATPMPHKMYKIYLLLVHTLGNRTIVHSQVDAELINEFLVVKAQTQIDFSEFDRVARLLILAIRIKLVKAILEYIKSHILLSKISRIVSKVVLQSIYG